MLPLSQLLVAQRLKKRGAFLAGANADDDDFATLPKQVQPVVHSAAGTVPCIADGVGLVNEGEPDSEAERTASDADSDDQGDGADDGIARSHESIIRELIGDGDAGPLSSFDAMLGKAGLVDVNHEIYVVGQEADLPIGRIDYIHSQMTMQFKASVER